MMSASGRTARLMEKVAVEPEAGEQLARERRLSLPEYQHVLSGPLNDIAARALQNDPALRFPSVDSFAAAIEAYRDRRTADRLAREDGGGHDAVDAPSGHRVAWAFVTGMAVGAAAVAALGL